jgi:hypothetical protein
MMPDACTANDILDPTGQNVHDVRHLRLLHRGNLFDRQHDVERRCIEVIDLGDPDNGRIDVGFLGNQRQSI